MKLVQPGNSPSGHPEAVAATLSALTDIFSRDLAHEILVPDRISRMP
jgi:hypothetical protein